MARIVLISLYDEFCLGPRYLSSVLKRAGHEVERVLFKHVHAADETPTQKQSPGDYLEHFYASEQEISLLQGFVVEKDPLWIGFSFASVSSGLAEELTRKVRQVSKAPIVWGGVDTTVNPEWAIQHADMICIGEGEQVCLEITEALLGQRDPDTIENLRIRKASGEIVRNPVRPLIQNLDDLPVPDFEHETAWHIDRNEIMPGHLPPSSPLNTSYIIMTSRGCPFRCSFCFNSTGHVIAQGKGKYLRRRSVENVIEELAGYKRKKPDTGMVMFYDDVFTFDRKWIQAFAEQYKREIDIPFWVYAYPDMCDPEILRPLREIGLIHLNIGIQSGSERTLREIYGRKMNPRKVLESAQVLRDLGIYPLYDLLAANPLETEEDLRASLDLMLSLPLPFGLNVWPMVFYRNYPITKAMEEAGHALVHVQGTHAAIAEETPYNRFWLALLRLTKYPQVPRETLRAFADRESLRNDPTALEEMEKALCEATFVPNTYFEHKDARIEKLTKESECLRREVDRLRNGKVFGLRSRIGRLLRRGSNAPGIKSS